MKPQTTPYETSVWCVRIVPKIGSPIRLTTYPVDLKMSNSTIYETDSGYEQTSFISSTSINPASIDLTGFVGVSGITREQIASGIFDNAKVYIFKCNYLNPVEDYEPITSGFFGKTTLEDDKYVIQGMSLVDALNQSVERIYAPACYKVFGSQEFAQCKKALGPLTVTGTITSVVDNYTFSDSSRSEALGYWNYGNIRFITGLNAGTKPIDIKSYGSGSFSLFEALYYTPNVGDQYELIPGCGKSRDECRDKWNNVVNFGGFPDLPPTSIYTQRGLK